VHVPVSAEPGRGIGTVPIGTETRVRRKGTARPLPESPAPLDRPIRRRVLQLGLRQQAAAGPAAGVVNRVGDVKYVLIGGAD
jgi:hypothetical protein